MTCSEIEDRVFGRMKDDSCRDADRNAEAPCSPDLLSLPCEAVCTSIDDCPTIVGDPDCAENCVDGFRSAENGSEACTGAIVDTLTCQAAMTCSEIENRVHGRTTDDSCRDADSKAAGLCLPL